MAWYETPNNAQGLYSKGLVAELRSKTSGNLPIRRRDLPDPLLVDVLTSATITPTATAGGSATTIASGVIGSNISDKKVQTLGGQTLATDASEQASPSLMFNWKNLTSGAASFPFPFTFGVEFQVINSQLIEFKFYAHTGYAYQLTVDGRKTTDLPVITGLTANSQNTVKYDLGDANLHRIKFWTNACSLSRVYTNPAGTVFPTTPRGGRWFGLGDSTMQGASAGTGAEADSWLLRLGNLCGTDDVWNGAIGGTGPLSTNSNASGNYLTRVTTDVAPANPDLVILGGYYNDLILNGQTAAAIAAQYNQILTALGQLTNCPAVVGVGSFDPLGVNGSNYTTVEAAVLPVFAANGVPFISPITGNTYDKTGTVVATSAPWINSANKAALISGDNVHQTDLGKKYTAYRVLEAMRPLMIA